MKVLTGVLAVLMGVATLSGEEVEIRSEVLRVEEITAPSGNTKILQVQLNTQNREMVMASIGPAWSLDTDLEEGEEITVRGRFTEENRFMVREIVRNNVRYQMRNEDYEPLWVRTRLRKEKHFYNPQNEKRMKCKVAELYIDEPSSMMEAKVKSKNGKTVRVRFAPEWYLQNRLRLGDELELRGSEVKSDGQIMILAREMRNLRTRQEINLRNRLGFPMWRGEGSNRHGKQPGHGGKKEGSRKQEGRDKK